MENVVNEPQNPTPSSNLARGLRPYGITMLALDGGDGLDGVTRGVPDSPRRKSEMRKTGVEQFRMHYQGAKGNDAFPVGLAEFHANFVSISSWRE